MTKAAPAAGAARGGSGRPIALSFILCSRNDAYMGNSRWRLETVLNSLAARVQAHGRTSDVEILVADWGSEVPLYRVVSLEPAAAALVRFVTVPPGTAVARQGDSPFPEVLALNAAARRARGEFIGRIDQDTIVGDRFLDWFFTHAVTAAGAQPPWTTTLLFANRRGVPFRFAARCPGRGHVERFVRTFGRWLPVWRRNRWYGHAFWTSYVGLWLAHRSLWDESRGYDERLIYYNWMEAEMINRLRRAHPIVDLGALTGCDFYHLEHFDPRAAHGARAHAKKNADLRPDAPPPPVQANDEYWGLATAEVTLDAAPARVEPARPGGVLAFAALVLRAAAGTIADAFAARGARQAAVLRRRREAVAHALAGRPIGRWPAALAALFHARKAGR